jgi:methylase of polypeptide subunit release factors
LVRLVHRIDSGDRASRRAAAHLYRVISFDLHNYLTVAHKLHIVVALFPLNISFFCFEEYLLLAFNTWNVLMSICMQYIDDKLKLYYTKQIYNPNYSSLEVIGICKNIIKPGYKVLDVACGSGLTGLALKSEHPSANVELCDIDPNCVRIAKLNAKRNGLSVHVFKSDLLSEAGKYDIICANLPTYDAEQMQSEELHGPKLAYNGGRDGMHLYRKLLDQARSKTTVLICECQEKHQRIFLEIAKSYGWKLLFKSEMAFAFSQ